MSDERLLPCPFCGGEAEIINEPAGYSTKRYVRCKYCSCRSAFTMYATTNVTAIEAWNTRKPMERIVEKLEQQKQQYKRRSEEATHILHGEFFGKMCSYDHAIKIVKGGGVDE